MKRFVPALALMLCSCVDLSGGELATESDERREVRIAFEERVEPLLEDKCSGCHTQLELIDFLSPAPTVFDRVMSYPALVDLGHPEASRLNAVEPHAEPWLDDIERDIVLEWIELAADRLGPR